MKSTIVQLANLIGETGLYRFLFPQKLPVFMIHRVSEHSDEIPGSLNADTLRRYLRYLASSGYEVLTVEKLWQFVAEGECVPSKSVMFTIDDGFYDHHDVAARVFDEYGFTLNFFVITDFLDQKLWPWDDQISYAFKLATIRHTHIDLPSGKVFPVDLEVNSHKEATREIRNLLKVSEQKHLYDWVRGELFKKLGVEFPSNIPKDYRPMSWDDARSLCERGHGIFPHTCSHRILSRLSENEKHNEIVDSQRRIKEELGFLAEVFAYPTGRLLDYNSLDIEILQKIGVKMAFNTVTNYVGTQPENSQYSIPRFSLPEKFSDFLQVVNRFELIKDSVKRS